MDNDDRMFELAFELLKASGSCSDLMDLVPRPYALGSSQLSGYQKKLVVLSYVN